MWAGLILMVACMATLAPGQAAGSAPKSKRVTVSMKSTSSSFNRGTTSGTLGKGTFKVLGRDNQRAVTGIVFRFKSGAMRLRKTYDDLTAPGEPAHFVIITGSRRYEGATGEMVSLAPKIGLRGTITFQ